MEDQEFERNEQMLEARRLKRLEQKRRRQIQQRIVLGVLAVILSRLYTDNFLGYFDSI